MDLIKSNGLLPPNDTKITISKLLDIAKQSICCDDLSDRGRISSNNSDKCTSPTIGLKYNTLTDENLLALPTLSFESIYEFCRNEKYQVLNKLSLSCFFFRSYIMHYNVSLFVILFVSQGIVPRSCLSATNTHYAQFEVYLPCIRTSLCESSIVYQSIALWNALPVELKNCHLSKTLNISIFIFYY